MKFWSIIILLFMGSTYVAQEELKWTKFEDLNDSLRNDATKGVMIYVHADWCKYCKLQENTSFKNDSIIQKLNKQYLLLEINTDFDREIEFLGKKYLPGNDQFRFHELSKFIGSKNGRIAVPSTVFFDESLDIKKRFHYEISIEELIDFL